MQTNKNIAQSENALEQYREKKITDESERFIFLSSQKLKESHLYFK